MRAYLKQFAADRQANTVVLLALLMPVVLGVAAGAVNYSLAAQEKASIQGALDSASLASVAMLGSASNTDASVQGYAKSVLSAFKEFPSIVNSQVAVDRGNNTVTINYTGPATRSIANVLWGGTNQLSVMSRARLKDTVLPVCILILEPTDNHTLRGSKGAQINLKNCLVQVNTSNWDAVEMADTAYMHSTAGQHCFVGDIHFGDVSPGKSPSCTLFPDPFANKVVPSYSNCDYTNLNVKSAATLTPGVYCGGLTIGADVTFSPGIYVIKDGKLQANSNDPDITANGVTFILTGKNASIDLNSGGTMKFSPTSYATGGSFAGFVFFLDPAAKAGNKSTISGAQVTMSGIVYLAGQQLVIDGGANVTVSPGAIVADYLLPQGGNLTLDGKLDSSNAAASAMQKALTSSGTPVLVN